jgi:hypothetical protein
MKFDTKRWGTKMKFVNLKDTTYFTHFFTSVHCLSIQPSFQKKKKHKCNWVLIWAKKGLIVHNKCQRTKLKIFKKFTAVKIHYNDIREDDDGQ